MGLYPHGRKVVLFGKPRNVYLLDDEFRDTLAAGVVRPELFGPYIRGRWVVTDAGTDDATFTFSLVVYAL